MMLMSLLQVLMQISHADCTAVQGFKNQSVVCQDPRAELFVKDQEVVKSVTLKLKDVAHGREQEITVKGLSLKVADFKSQNFMKNKAIQKQLAVVEKAWKTTPEAEVQSLELDQKVKYFATADFSKEIKWNAVTKEKRAVASAGTSTATYGAVMRAQRAKAQKGDK